MYLDVSLSEYVTVNVAGVDLVTESSPEQQHSLPVWRHACQCVQAVAGEDLKKQRSDGSG